ncbi:MAG: phosphoribosylformylglycinamidine synthase subunit PurS, partial [Candidatus Margulisiibacteriota bacterium]
KKGILDPQGKTVEAALHSLGYKNVSNVHIGKYIELEIPETRNQKPEKQINEMCKKLLANPIIEDYRFEVEE